MLASLLNMPTSEQEWNRWSFHHRYSHQLIRQAINAQLGVMLPDYPMDPIVVSAPKGFLTANQQSHIDMNRTLNRPASDLDEVNFTDEHALRAWIYLHWQEHNVAENTLEIGS